MALEAEYLYLSATDPLRYRDDFVPENQIDAAIDTRSVCVVSSKPDLGDLGGPLRIGLKEPPDEHLELFPSFRGVSVKSTQQVSEIRHLTVQILVEPITSSRSAIVLPRYSADDSLAAKSRL